MRAAALHSRMEEEYRCALKSSSQECARLESWAERLEGELLDERRSHELRYCTHVNARAVSWLTKNRRPIVIGWLVLRDDWG